MARVDVHDNFCFLHHGDEVAIYPYADTHVTQAEILVPKAALHTLVLRELGRGQVGATSMRLAHLLLDVQDLEDLTTPTTHPGVSLDHDGMVVVTGPARNATRLVNGDAAPEVTYRVPLEEVRALTFGDLRDAIVSRVEQMDGDDLASLALAVLPLPAARA